MQSFVRSIIKYQANSGIEQYLSDLDRHFITIMIDQISGKFCYGKIPIQTFDDSKNLDIELNNEFLYLEDKYDSHHYSDNQAV